MFALIHAEVTYFRAFFLPRHRLGLEAAALRQQLTVLQRKQPRPRLRHLDRLFWMALRRWWPDWANALFVVQADTVVSWHRLGFLREERVALVRTTTPSPILRQLIPSNHMFAVGVQDNSQRNQSSLLNWT